jgi:hypothetical protein
LRFDNHINPLLLKDALVSLGSEAAEARC